MLLNMIQAMMTRIGLLGYRIINVMNGIKQHGAQNDLAILCSSHTIQHFIVPYHFMCCIIPNVMTTLAQTFYNVVSYN
jgi:hypothetical protein